MESRVEAGKRIELKSVNLAWVEFHPATCELLLGFRGGTEGRFLGVVPEMVESLIRADGTGVLLSVPPQAVPAYKAKAGEGT